MKVLIIGDIDGLCLAHGLERAGIDFTVFERDHDADARLQGYLPGSLWDVLVATAGDPDPRMGVFDERLRQLMQEDEPGADATARSSNKHWVSSINLVNPAGLRPQDSAFVGLSNFPSFDRNHAGEERTHMSFGFF
jgi:2-polyprenyl-6-methoxyphenol hydroxylase-like FAD-dependent oxidoreductase